MYESSSGIAGNRAFLPSEVGPLIVQPIERMSVALQVATVINVGAQNADFRLPVVTGDPNAAWTAEGAEIAPSDATFAEEVVPFSKLAALTIMSRELAEDSNPAAAEVVGQGMARDIAQRIDAAFFGDLAAPAPPGLETLAGVTNVSAGAAYTNLDAFLQAISEAEELGATVTAFATNPATALILAQLKQETGSNAPLLQPDPTMPTRRMVSGVPLYVSPAVTAGVVWAIPKDRVYVALREDVTLAVDRSVFFTSDRVAVRATCRAGFGFPHPAAVVRVATA
jgi:HK97 family phage major capsid protein